MMSACIRRVLTPDEVGALTVRDSVDVLARMKPPSRTVAQTDKLRLCFLETGAPRASQDHAGIAAIGEGGSK